MSTPSLSQLHRAIKIAEQIQSLESELAAILGNASGPVTKSVAPSASAPAKKGKRKYTKRASVTEADAANAVIAGLLGNSKRKYTKKAATSTESPAPAKKKGKKGKMSAEGRAAIVAAQKARWAKVKKTKSKG